MENAFLQVLSVVDDDTISAAFGDRQERGVLSKVLASSTDSSKAGSVRLLAQWEKYPLKTAEDIRRWASAKLEEPTKPLEGSGADADADADDLELGDQDTSDMRGSSVYDSSSRHGQAVPSPLDSLSLEDETIELPRDFKEQFLW